MDSSQTNYISTAQAYSAGVRALFSPSGKTGKIKRGTEGAFVADDITTRAAQLIPISRDLTRVTTEKLEDADPTKRAEASLQMLAKVLVDLQVSEFLFQAAQEQERGTTPAALSGTQRGSVGRISVEENLSIILGETTETIVSNERGISTPKDIPTAQILLKQSGSDVLLMVEKRASRTGQVVLGGLLTMGVGQVFQAAGIVTMNVAQMVGAAEKVSQLYILFRQFFASAYSTLVSLLGPTITQAVANQVATWVNEVLQGEKFAALIGKIYETSKTQQEIQKIITESPAAMEAYVASLESLNSLNSQYLKQIGVIEKMVTALNFIKSIPAAALPQARLLLGATYIVLTGYVIFSGADYVDAPHFTKLDRIPGPSRIIRTKLGNDKEAPEDDHSSHEEEEPIPSGVHTIFPAGKGLDDTGTKIPRQTQAVSYSSEQEFMAGDQQEKKAVETQAAWKEEKIRLDLAVPQAPVTVGEPFEIAVAIRRPISELLSLEGLENVSTSNGTVYRQSSSDLVLYRVKVSATNCTIETSEYTFRLRAGEDSGPCFFYLTPIRAGTIYITVTAFQEADLFIAQTRRQLKASIQSIAPQQSDPNISRQDLISQLEKKNKTPKAKRKTSKTPYQKKYVNFDINLYDYQVNKSQQETFKVSVESILAVDRNLEDPDTVVVPDDLRQTLRMLDNRSLVGSDMVELGKKLGDLLLPQKARRYFDLSRARLKEDQALRIRIKTRAYPLASIAWEYAYILPENAGPDYEGEEGFLALDKQISITRYEVMGKPIVSLNPVNADNIRMVMLIANPEHPDFPKLQLDKEEKNVQDAVKGIPEIRLEVFPDASIQILEDAFINPAHIFHFAGHGTFQSELGAMKDTVVGKGYLILHEENQEDCFFSASRLASTLKDCGVRLAVLGVCEGGARDVENAWTGITAALSYSGIPAVVAMQFRVYDKSALVFHRMFYRTLAAGHSIDAAVANGRQAIANRSKGDRDWGVPVLYLRTDENGELFPKNE